MNAQTLPTDKFIVTLNRQAMTIIGAFIQDRKQSVEKAIADKEIKHTKKANRILELAMIEDA